MTPVTSTVAGLLQHQMTRHFSRPQVSNALPAALQQEGVPANKLADAFSVFWRKVCEADIRLCRGFAQHCIHEQWMP